MSHRFLYIYKYRLYGKVYKVTLQGQGEPCMVLLSTEKKNQYHKPSLNYPYKRKLVHQNHDYDQNHYYNILMSNKVSEYSEIQNLILLEGIEYYQYIQA